MAQVEGPVDERPVPGVLSPFFPGLDHHLFIKHPAWLGLLLDENRAGGFSSRRQGFISVVTVAVTWHMLFIFNYLHFVVGKNRLNHVLHFVKGRTESSMIKGTNEGCWLSVFWCPGLLICLSNQNMTVTSTLLALGLLLSRIEPFLMLCHYNKIYQHLLFLMEIYLDFFYFNKQ